MTTGRRAVDEASDRDKDAFLAALRASLDDGTFLKITLGKFRGQGPEARTTATRVIMKGEPHLKLVTRRGAHDLTSNDTLNEAAVRLASLIGADYLSATLFTTREDLSLVYSKKRVARLTRGKPSLTEAPPVAHNRTKDYLVDQSAPYLGYLGVTHADTPNKPPLVKQAMYGKFRQICRFVEILDQLIADSPLRDSPSPRIVDIGSGKGYLTFALHDHLMRRRAKTPKTVGIDANPALVTECNRVAALCALPDLTFEATTADSRALGALDILIALHACDTATDDAIGMGIAGDAALIICAPCCQHEIAPQLDGGAGSPLSGLIRFGLLKQRQADLVTDAMRALLLEAQGYEVRIIEFVSTEHTAKNLMLTAVRSLHVNRQRAEAELSKLVALTGIRHQRLRDRLASR